MADTTPAKSPQKSKPKKHKSKGPKPKMTKEERRAKYTAIARDRRDKRVKRNHEKDIICYRCRKKGHSAEHCTADGNNNTKNNNTKSKKASMICYKCGSTEHRIQQCAKIKPYLKNKNDAKIDFGKLGDLPYANCYICNESGHLSSFCPKNTKGGVFPDGGVCRECGEGGHFAKDCPNKNKKKGDDDDGSVSDNSVAIEEFLEDEDEKKKEDVKKAPKKKKVVNF